MIRRGRLLAGDTDGYQCEQRYLHRDGHVVWGQLACELERDAAGRAHHFIVQFQDITRFKVPKRHCGLARSSRHAPARPAPAVQLLDQARDAIVVQDMDRTIRYWSMGAERMFGFPATRRWARLSIR